MLADFVEVGRREVSFPSSGSGEFVLPGRSFEDIARWAEPMGSECGKEHLEFFEAILCYRHRMIL